MDSTKNVECVRTRIKKQLSELKNLLGVATLEPHYKLGDVIVSLYKRG